MECVTFPEYIRGSECVECSKSIAKQDLVNVNRYKENIITAADATCFDPAILAAFISRQTRGGSDLAGTNGWIPCHNYPKERCFGIMHMPECKLMTPLTISSPISFCNYACNYENENLIKITTRSPMTVLVVSNISKTVSRSLIG